MKNSVNDKSITANEHRYQIYFGSSVGISTGSVWYAITAKEYRYQF
jgi:hypothetical protein